MKVLEFKGVGFGYPGQTPIISGVNFFLNRGEHVLILGPNGSGKSTFAFLAVRLLSPKTGEIVFHAPPSSIEGYPKIGIVFQNSRLQIVGTTVEEDLAFGLTVLNYPAAKIKDQVNHFLDFFDFTPKRFQSVHQLSGGELRRLALASTLITEPDLLILDEPLSMLDCHSQELFLKIFHRVISKETAVIWLDHDVRSIRYLEKRYLLHQKGCLTPITLADLNSEDFVRKSFLNPAPLQYLEWKYPEQVSRSIFGPDQIEFS
jgi:energy-coupling factor transporter ATP-binding protein EcfA2